MATEALMFTLQSKKALAAINLKRKTEYNYFKPAQIQCLKSALSSDTLGILPTGYGKSLIFEALPYFQSSSSAVIVITPLNSIIAEQIKRYGEYSVHFGDSCVPKSLQDKVKYIIGHPESFISKKAFQFFRTGKWQSRITNIVIDEAHCVSQWGDGFRDKFLDIIKMRSLFPNAKLLALTATATIKLQKEITDMLGMKKFKIIQGSIDRANIKLEVKRRPAGCGRNSNVEESYDFVIDPLIDELCNITTSFPKTVVYTKLKWCGYEKGHRMSMRTNNNLKQFIAQYHSPCTSEMRDKVLCSMADPNGATKLLFATEAYSMGTDAPDIRRVIHAGVPTRLETYIQEIGRAGRDGKAATATLYYNMKDISNSTKGITEEIKQFCTLETCRREFLCQHFGVQTNSSVFTFKHDCCDICEQSCQCEICTNKNLTLCCEGLKSHASNNQTLNKDLHVEEQLEAALLEYFIAENEVTGVPNGEIITGLTPYFAKEISKNFSLYTDENHILAIHETLASHIAGNIALIVNEIC